MSTFVPVLLPALSAVLRAAARIRDQTARKRGTSPAGERGLLPLGWVAVGVTVLAAPTGSVAGGLAEENHRPGLLVINAAWGMLALVALTRLLRRTLRTAEAPALAVPVAAPAFLVMGAVRWGPSSNCRLPCDARPWGVPPLPAGPLASSRPTSCGRDWSIGSPFWPSFDPRAPRML
ncbi:hypothetical protein AAGT00_04040 [Streptomyces cavourensis]